MDTTSAPTSMTALGRVRDVNSAAWRDVVGSVISVSDRKPARSASVSRRSANSYPSNSGRYYALIVSSNARRAYWEPFSPSELDRLVPLVDTNVTAAQLSRDGNRPTSLRFDKFAIETVTVRPNGTVHFSHDFGKSAFR
jgi:hypothetical protein